MHPAFSVIGFTVASGAGYGLFILLVLAEVYGFADIDVPVALSSGLLALVLISGGLLSSTLHLANPKNAWRAFFRFRTSWLSREGVFAVLFYPAALLYLIGVYVNDAQPNGLVSFVGLSAVVIALATVFSTGMIYGCLKTIRQWNTALTPTNYILLALATGSVLLVMILAFADKDINAMAGIAIALLALGAIAKAIYYFWVRTVTGPTINTATGFTRAKVRLLDTGHTAGTFLTQEFGYQAPMSLLTQLRVVVFALGFAVPAALLAFMILGLPSGLVALVGVVAMFAGIAAERWLFFAEARHVINLYHGAQHT
ncbi:MAG: DmsC/YnfH family molybdoenzyme membrane anchor subunit [Thiofilum sp.]|uniref:dimethyl sulfoxide reductase anchor subunit family protein n=1 Tax=Thiofilum sp. TaxID=2212733 RepID=UPI0025F5979A|nr:DmsC/YnfH family molybdoenzyme membrane anchor subunit [Thiofilum sp.]MBK8452823.1 dimethyl sulfoxide reductase anchor subunit [Thiofilum sp.]